MPDSKYRPVRSPSPRTGPAPSNSVLPPLSKFYYGPAQGWSSSENSPSHNNGNAIDQANCGSSTKQPSFRFFVELESDSGKCSNLGPASLTRDCFKSSARKQSSPIPRVQPRMAVAQSATLFSEPFRKYHIQSQNLPACSSSNPIASQCFLG